jgi:hypothetical protein
MTLTTLSRCRAAEPIEAALLDLNGGMERQSSEQMTTTESTPFPRDSPKLAHDMVALTHDTIMLWSTTLAQAVRT